VPIIPATIGGSRQCIATEAQATHVPKAWRLFCFLLGLWYPGPVATVILDTHRLISHLKEHGFSENQATGITEAMQEIDLSQLATRADLRELELRMTVKLGSLIVAGTAFLAVLKLFA